MKRLSQHFAVLGRTLRTLRGLAFNAQHKSSLAHPFSWHYLRYTLALLSALLVTFTAFPLLSNQAHANQPPVIGNTIDTYLCGSDTQFPNNASNTWAPVAAGTIAYEPDGTVVHAVGYQGASSFSASCSGNYNYGLDQYYHLAQWSFQSNNAPGSYYLVYKNSPCSMSVFIPTWYAGAPDAQYALTITGVGTRTVSFDAFNQNQSSSGWYTLTVNGQNQFPLGISPNSGLDAYDFTLTLRNGGGQGGQWYLAADAIHFTCKTQ